VQRLPLLVLLQHEPHMRSLHLGMQVVLAVAPDERNLQVVLL
jgi:hypothetical protein